MTTRKSKSSKWERVLYITHFYPRLENFIRVLSVRVYTITPLLNVTHSNLISCPPGKINERYNVPTKMDAGV